MDLILTTGKLYLLSGVQGSGKSTFLKKNVEKGNIPADSIVSADKTRKDLKGIKYSFRNGRIVKELDHKEKAAIEIVIKKIQTRLEEGLTTFVDMTLLNDKKRQSFVNMAKKLGVETTVLIIEKEIKKVLEQNEGREFSIREEVVKKAFDEFQQESKFDHITITGNENIVLVPANQISEEHMDIVGDTHGLYEKTKDLLTSMGYEISKHGIFHPENRKLLFLGDFVDRGEDSIAMIKLMIKAKKSGHYVLIGNHENRLLKNLSTEISNVAGSHAAIKTFLEVKKNKMGKEVSEFLKSLPAYYVHEKHGFVFSHGNVEFFDPVMTTKSDLIYGIKDEESENSDLAYTELYARGINRYKLIRGHVPIKHRGDVVFSLETGICENGKLSALPFDKFIEKGGDLEAFDKTVVQLDSNFCYNEEKRNVSMLTQIRQLKKARLVTEVIHPSGLMKLYKYSKSVFYKNLWKEGGWPLKKSRGLVLDLSGEIIVHPFDKYFNYKENDAGKDVKDDEVVQYVEKLNGFLGNISFNPFEHKLLFTASGSFEAKKEDLKNFPQMFQKMVSNEDKKKLISYLAKNRMTLSFEVIHPDDPHIIKYDESMHGYHLIGARKLSINDKPLSEEELDEIAKELGLRRPSYGYAPFSEVKEMNRKCKIEGYMIRRKNKDGYYEHDFKMKSPFYLTTKFISRMSDGKVKFMFSNPEAFKKNVDEELWPIVDKIVKSISVNEFIEMDKEKTDYVRKIVDDFLK